MFRLHRMFDGMASGMFAKRGGPPFGLGALQNDPNVVQIPDPSAIWGAADFLPRRNLLTSTATLATQTKTVTAVSHTLYIKGTGSVTLSGAATGTLNGTGSSDRVSLVFTPTAGSLTLTVSGTVTEGHLSLTSTTDHSYQAVTDWTTEQYAWAAQKNVPWLRRNLLLNTETGSSWTKTALGVGIAPIITDNYGVAPDGSNTAIRVQLNTNGGTTSSDISTAKITCSATRTVQSYEHSVWIKSLSGTPTIKLSDQSFAPSNITLTTEWREYTFSATASDTSASIIFSLRGTYGTSDTADILVWNPLKSVGTTQYQSVGASWDATYTALAQAAGYPISMFQDAAGTTATSGPDLTVRKMLDLSGDNNHATAPSDAARPVLRLDGNGKWYLERDLSDDNLAVTWPTSLTTTGELYVAERDQTTLTTGMTLSGATSYKTPKYDYGRVVTKEPSANSAKIIKYLDKKAGR